jgi:hypothetical protein
MAIWRPDRGMPDMLVVPGNIPSIQEDEHHQDQAFYSKNAAGATFVIKC